MILIKTIEGHRNLSFQTTFTIMESFLGDISSTKKVNLFCFHALFVDFFANGMGGLKMMQK